MTAYRRLEINEVGDVTVVRFRDHKIVEDINIQQLGQEMFHLVEVDNRDKVLLNFSSVDFLSSAALGKLITLDKKMKAHGGTLKLVQHPPGNLRSLRHHQAQSLVRYQGRRGRRAGGLLRGRLGFVAHSPSGVRHRVENGTVEGGCALHANRSTSDPAGETCRRPTRTGPGSATR